MNFFTVRIFFGTYFFKVFLMRFSHSKIVGFFHSKTTSMSQDPEKSTSLIEDDIMHIVEQISF